MDVKTVRRMPFPLDVKVARSSEPIWKKAVTLGPDITVRSAQAAEKTDCARQGDEGSTPGLNDSGGNRGDRQCASFNNVYFIYASITVCKHVFEK